LLSIRQENPIHLLKPGLTYVDTRTYLHASIRVKQAQKLYEQAEPQFGKSNAEENLLQLLYGHIQFMGI